MGQSAAAGHPGMRVLVEVCVGLTGLALLAGAWLANWHWYEVHATWCYCAEVGRQVGLWRFWRVVTAVAGAALLLVARPALGRHATRTPARSLLAWSGRVGGAVVLALVVSEMVLHAWPPRRKRGPYLDAVWEPDDRYAWRPVSSRITEHRVAGRMVRFVTDENRYRVRSAEARIDFARPTILSTGESVASGYALDYDETYAAMLADRLGVQVANLAVTAYANDQAYLRLVDELPRFARPLATLTIVLPLALDRDVTPERWHLVPSSSQGLTLEPAAESTLLGQSRLLSLFGDVTGLHSDAAIPRIRAIMEATARASLQRGAFPLFILLDWPTCLPDGSGAPSIERTLFEGLDVTHVRVHLPREDYDQTMYHPNAEGHRAIADAVERVLVERGALAAAGVPSNPSTVTR
jgi:hypothetical protein